MICVLNDPARWDLALEDSYWPFISYTHAWLDGIGNVCPHLRVIPLAKRSPEGAIEYVCPCFADRQRRALTTSVFLTPGFVNRNVEPTEVLLALHSLAREENSNSISLQVPPGFGFSDTILAGGYALKSKVCFYLLDLEGIDSFETCFRTLFSGGRRGDIKAARKKGVAVVTLSPSEDALGRFYPVYEEMGKRRNADLLPRSSLGKITYLLGPCSRFWIASVDGRDIGSALTIGFQNRLWVWLLQGATAFREYKTDAMLYAEIIRYGLENGYRVIDLGTSPFDSPLGAFKMRFGARPVFHDLYQRDLSPTRIAASALLDIRRALKLRYGTKRA